MPARIASTLCALALLAVPAAAAAQPVPSQPDFEPYQFVPPEPKPFKVTGFPIFRISNGAGIHHAGRELLASYDLDIHAGWRLELLKKTLFLATEATYSFNSEPSVGGHVGAIGLGPILTGHSAFIGIGVLSRFVIGATWQGFAAGVRNSIIVPVFYHLVSLEIGHQYLRGDGFEQNEIRAQIGIEPLAIFYPLADIGGDFH